MPSSQSNLPAIDKAHCASCEKEFHRVNLEDGICTRCVEIDSAVGEDEQTIARNRPQCSCGLVGWKAFNRAVSTTTCRDCLNLESTALDRAAIFESTEQHARDQVSSKRLRTNQEGVPSVSLQSLKQATSSKDPMLAAAAAAQSEAVPSITAQIMFLNGRKYELWVGTVAPGIIDCSWSTTMGDVIKLAERKLSEAWPRGPRLPGMRSLFKDHTYDFALYEPSPFQKPVKVEGSLNPKASFFEFWEVLCVKRRKFLPTRDIGKGVRVFRMLFLIDLGVEMDEDDVVVMSPQPTSKPTTMGPPRLPTVRLSSQTSAASLDLPSVSVYANPTFSLMSALRTPTNLPTPRSLTYDRLDYKTSTYEFEVSGEGFSRGVSSEIFDGGMGRAEFGRGAMKIALNFRPRFDDPSIVEVAKTHYRLAPGIREGVDQPLNIVLLECEVKLALKAQLFLELFYARYDQLFAKARARTAPRLRISPPRLITAIDQAGAPGDTWLVERKGDPRAFVKLSNTSTFAKTDNLTQLEEDMSAFIHFAFQKSFEAGIEAMILFADIQGYPVPATDGKGNGFFQLSDVMSHSPLGDSCLADGGLDELQHFVRHHRCTPTCAKFKFPPLPTLDDLQLPGVQIQPAWIREIERREVEASAPAAPAPGPASASRSGGAGGMPAQGASGGGISESGAEVSGSTGSAAGKEVEGGAGGAKRKRKAAAAPVITRKSSRVVPAKASSASQEQEEGVAEDGARQKGKGATRRKT